MSDNGNHAVIQLTALQTSKAQLTRQGLILDPALSYTEWEAIGQTLQAVARCIQLAIGDWLVFGEHHYGEHYTQAVEITGRDEGTLANYQWVAQAVPPSLRNELLNFDHYRFVARLPEVDQRREYLAAAVTNDWSARELDRQIKHDTGVPIAITTTFTIIELETIIRALEERQHTNGGSTADGLLNRLQNLLQRHSAIEENHVLSSDVAS